jgi:hypothetical protein
MDGDIDNHRKGVFSHYDDYDTGNRQYYTNEQRKRRTIGNTISFYDGPNRPYADDAWFFSADLSLYDRNNKLILKINYGFTVNGNNTTAYPITIITP